MSFNDPDQHPDDGDHHEGGNSNANIPLLLAIFGAGILLLIVLLYFAY